ncbi:hypothetical protein [Methylobacterium haplocladii]|uniref:Uncharacterized protein n=1 Tax=Methylobacterium haplocladii TaxID=1176176 RepID=A0A512IST5_9HYPH|nr:hypothetical protein [Methylobacterium haplocladii]GEP00767.1 hypothetical protein MHA02_31540 [Methylobacterium haplocladii]GJD83102.1 hypothetical protein HPGCJGGD_0964 [Methylobacterium haplocladii]GLS59502.1 hypothetical protein GCM10007887_21710 [Methylobacterium haplocladii]
MSTLIFRPARSGSLFGVSDDAPWNAVKPPTDDHDPCGGERIIDFALCLIVAASVVGLMLLAL